MGSYEGRLEETIISFMLLATHLLMQPRTQVIFQVLVKIFKLTISRNVDTEKIFCLQYRD